MYAIAVHVIKNVQFSSVHSRGDGPEPHSAASAPELEVLGDCHERALRHTTRACVTGRHAVKQGHQSTQGSGQERIRSNRADTEGHERYCLLQVQI
jgi:hypothetical protein